MVTKQAKTGSKNATWRDVAKMDFKPWTLDKRLPPGELFPTREGWEEMGFTARVAYATMLRTKEQLMEGMPPLKTLKDLIYNLEHHREGLKVCMSMMSAHT
jgi:hypothetical protein